LVDLANHTIRFNCIINWSKVDSTALVICGCQHIKDVYQIWKKSTV